MEKILQTKTCKLCNISFDITDRDMSFYDQVGPIFDGRRYPITPPTFCPTCRHQRRISFRNERKLYWRKCDLTGANIISIYSPDKPYKVYELSAWMGDGWDAKEFAQDFDFTRPFFPQLCELSQSVPHLSRYVIESTGSEYINGAGHIKDSYLCFNVDYIEDSAYCFTTNNAKSSFDCSFCTDIENCYACTSVDRSHTLLFSQESQDCSNSYFLSNCSNCHHCFGCVNQVNKNYCIYNEQYSEDDYHKKIEEILSSRSFEELKKHFDNYKLPFPKRATITYLTTNSLADYSRQIKDSSYVFDSINVENSKYVWYVHNAKNCMDYDVYGDNSELIYEAVMTGTQAYKSAFCFSHWMGGRDCYYSTLLLGCRNCFGCVGLKNQQYCVFNKQYTKEEYEKLVPEIITHMQKTGEWGEYFPSYMSACGYNESVAQDYFPLTKEQALSKGFAWSDYVAPEPKFERVIPASKVPSSIADIPDDVLNWAIECEVSKRLFRITKIELEYYRKFSLPLPGLHPDERHLLRLRSRNPRQFFTRNCDSCKKEIQTTYAPERKEKVFCEKCYEKEIF